MGEKGSGKIPTTLFSFFWPHRGGGGGLPKRRYTRGEEEGRNENTLGGKLKPHTREGGGKREPP